LTRWAGSAATPIGRAFGRVAEAYDRTRPGYPPEALDRATRELGLSADATVLDLAAGTGVLTRLLRQRFSHVVAVEPDDDMRAFVEDALAGSAEAIPVDDASVDAVFVGEAFHWFDAPVALAEIARVLRGGGLAVIANAWGEKLTPGLLPRQFADELDAIWARFHAPDRVFADWREAVAGSAFGPVGHAQFDWVARISGRDLVDLQLTASTPASIGDDERRAVAERAYPLMEDAYDMPVNTHLDWTRLA